MGRLVRAVQVMVVEDDRELRDELCELLAFEGYEPIGCPTVRAAWTQLASGLRPRVVVTDLALPDLSGREFIKLIRDQAWGRQLPILLLSAWENAGRFDIGADTVLVKGGEPESIARAVDRLARSPLQPQSAAGPVRRPPRRARDPHHAASKGSPARPTRWATGR